MRIFGDGDPTSEITVRAENEWAKGYLVSREEIVVFGGMELVDHGDSQRGMMSAWH